MELPQPELYERLYGTSKKNHEILNTTGDVKIDVQTDNLIEMNKTHR